MDNIAVNIWALIPEFLRICDISLKFCACFFVLLIDEGHLFSERVTCSHCLFKNRFSLVLPPQHTSKYFIVLNLESLYKGKKF